MRILAIVASLALLLTGCAAQSAAQSGTSTHSIRFDGIERSYIVTAPAITEPVPLVVMLHGGFGSASQAEQGYGWDELADTEGFVVVYPDGLGKAWNVGDGCCGEPGQRGIDDVGFVSAVVAEVSETYAIDPDRVFATGMSNGAMMSYRLACDTTLFAAIAPVAGTLVGDCDSPEPVSVLAIHGTADDRVRMDGLEGAGAAHIDGMDIASLHELWLEADGCPAPTVTTESPVTTSSASCDEHSVSLITVDGAGHQWPGSTRNRAQERLGTDVPSDALDATATIWEFFAAQS
jgi:polyhydroxybutyrate depolymerase